MATTARKPAFGATTDKLAREIVTPEGVTIQVRLASRSERASAFVVDLLIVGIALVLLWIFFWAALAGSEISLAIVILISFAIRSFYFAFFELTWRGSTPGKRALNLRVIDRSGGMLTPSAVLARNLMREAEVFLPISLIPTVLVGEGTAATVFALIWVAVFTLMPMFNRNNMRMGDFVAGTWVISLPKTALRSDLARRPHALRDSASPYRFSDEQLRIYGIYELQTLEGVLRDGGTAEVHRAIATRICAKIDYAHPEGEPFYPRAFLEAFYQAQRGRLETDLLFGKRRESKHDRRR